MANRNFMHLLANRLHRMDGLAKGIGKMILQGGSVRKIDMEIRALQGAGNGLIENLFLERLKELLRLRIGLLMQNKAQPQRRLTKLWYWQRHLDELNYRNTIRFLRITEKLLGLPQD